MLFARGPEEWEFDTATTRARSLLLDLLELPGSEGWVDGIADDLRQIGPEVAERDDQQPTPDDPWATRVVRWAAGR